MMTAVNLDTRLRKLEKREGHHADLSRMSDKALMRCIRSGYRALMREHGSLEAAAQHLGASADPDDVSLAILIREDIDEGRANTRGVR